MKNDIIKMGNYSKVFQSINKFGLLFTVKLYIFKFRGKDEKVTDLIDNRFAKLFKSFYCNIVLNNNPPQSKIYVWSSWWQGEDSLPEILRICYNSHKKYIFSNEYFNVDYIFITKNNYKEYIDLPDYIISKFERGIISYTHFSDILRVFLLEKYGGMWLDITVLMIKPLDYHIFDNDFFSVNLSDAPENLKGGQLITYGKWAGFLLAAKTAHSPLFEYLKASLEYYWKNFNYTIDYFLLNRLIRVAYNNNLYIRRIVNSIPFTNQNMYKLQPVINTSFDKNLWEELKNKTTFFKLTQKIPVYKNNGNCQTFYGYISIYN